MTRTKFNAAAALASATESASLGRAEVRDVESRAGITVTEVSVAELMPNPANPAHRATDNLDELAGSLREVGLLQPLVVRPRRDTDSGTGSWMILGGHRRWGAAKLAGLERVPVHVATGEVDVQVMLIENLQRTDISPMEEARSYQLLRDQGFTQTQIAKMVSISQGQVSKRLALLKMDEVVQDALDQGKVGLDAVYSVLNDTEPDIARKAVQKVLRRPNGSAPATAEDLGNVVRDTRWDAERAQRRESYLNDARLANATIVAKQDLPPDVIIVPTGDRDRLAALGANGHLYFAISSDHWDYGTYYTDDPATLTERDQAEQARVDAVERDRRQREQLQEVVADVWRCWADSITERTGGEGSDDVARFVLRHHLRSHGSVTRAELAGWVGSPYEGPEPLSWSSSATHPEWLQWVDGLTKARRWRAARLVAAGTSLKEDDVALLNVAEEIAPDLAHRWLSLDPTLEDARAERENANTEQTATEETR